MKLCDVARLMFCRRAFSVGSRKSVSFWCTISFSIHLQTSMDLFYHTSILQNVQYFPYPYKSILEERTVFQNIVLPRCMTSMYSRLFSSHS